MQEDLATMAQYMQQEFKTAFRNDPYRRFQVVDVPQKGSLTLELALTELVPSNVALSVLEYAPYGGGTAVRVMERATSAESTVAFEARMKDSDTGDTLAMFADRQVKKSGSLISRHSPGMPTARTSSRSGPNSSWDSPISGRERSSRVPAPSP